METSINGATRVLVNVTSGNDLTLQEFTEAANQIQELCDQNDANIIFGWVADPGLEGEVRVTVLATGFNGLSSAPDIAKLTPNATPAPTPQPPPRTATAYPNTRPYQPGDSINNGRSTSQPPANQPATNAPTTRAGETPPPSNAPATPSQSPPQPERKSSNEDIDIPAFLRRRP